MLKWKWKLKQSFNLQELKRFTLIALEPVDGLRAIINRIRNMILILSRQDDGSTALVIQWLIAMKKPYIRLNADSANTRFISMDPARRELIIEQDGVRMNIFDVESVWYRRRGISEMNLIADDTNYAQGVFPDDEQFCRKHISAETRTLVEFIHSVVEGNCRRSIGSHLSVDVNKLKVLQMAAECGLKTPRSFIVSTKQDLEDKIKAHHHVITKAISGQGVYFPTRQHHYYSYTEKLTLASTKHLPEVFFPSLIQTEIKKRLELRVFYLKGTFYTMAIFSQGDKKTSVDFRKYNKKKPSRLVPYLLPALIQEKLRTLLDRLNLDTGSIDLIVDTNNDYYFLEVNPIGQFSMTSMPCNYYLEKKIAQIL